MYHFLVHGPVQHNPCIGIIKYSICFAVPVPPKISNISSDVTVNEGSNVTLVCMANGRPEPVITWRHLTPTGRQHCSFVNVFKCMSFCSEDFTGSEAYGLLLKYE